MTRTNESVYKCLRRLFKWSEIEIKIQSRTKDGTKGKPAPYFDARAVRDRLDEAFGPENWDELHEPYHLQKESGDKCTLILRFPDGQQVRREEVSDASDIEAMKGAVSGSLKRAFSALGNRSLYEIELGWHPLENEGKRFTKEAFAKMEDMYVASCKSLVETGGYYE